MVLMLEETAEPVVNPSVQPGDHITGHLLMPDIEPGPALVSVEE